jgi:hypothetical protein
MNKTYGLVLKVTALVIGVLLMILSIIGNTSDAVLFALSGVGIFAIALESLLKYTYGLHK